MHRTKIVMSSLGVVGLVLAGCSTGGDDDATSPQASTGGPEPITTPSDDSPDESPSEDDDDEGGEASGDLVAWAGDFCGAIAPLEEQFTDLGDDFTPDPSGTADPFAGMAETFAQLGPAFAAAADAIEGTGPPPIDGGEEAFDAMVSSLRSASDLYAGIEDQLEGLDPADPNFQAEVAKIFAEIGPEFEESTQMIDEVFSSSEMEAAFGAAPECEDLDIGGE